MSGRELSNGIYLHHGDCLDVLAGLRESSVDAIVTDPPYELGFMGRAWDASGVAFDPATWAAVLRVLKPGGHLVAFGAPKNYHRLACAIEDAGFEVRDSLMWVFGSGFPKSLDVSKALDKAAGAEREVVSVTPRNGNPINTFAEGSTNLRPWQERQREEYGGLVDIKTAPATDAARQWQGWGTALKPAWESIIVASKPLEFAVEISKIGSKIVELERQLWSMLPANVAEQCFGLSQAALNAVCASAPWSAEQRSDTLGALRAQMDTWQFVSALISSLSTVSLWKATLVENSTQESMSIIETELKTIIDLRTLKFLLSKITPESIILAQQNGLKSNAHALHAVRNFNAIVLKLSATLELSVVESAISQEAENCRGVADGPNAEPIVLARKPLSEKTVAANVLRWGTGALNIDGCRIPSSAEDQEAMRRVVGFNVSYSNGEPSNSLSGGADGSLHRRDRVQFDPSKGRWPANLAHDGSDEVLAGFPITAPAKRGVRDPNGSMGYHGGASGLPKVVSGHDDNGGSAARFFYCAKASKTDRAGSKHPTVKPVALMRWLCRMVTPPGGTILDPFAGSGTTGQAAAEEGFNAILIEREAEYIADIERRLSARLSQRIKETVSKPSAFDDLPLLRGAT